MSYAIIATMFLFFGRFWLFVLFKKNFIGSRAFPQNDLKREKKKNEDENGNENEAAKEAKFLTHSELTLDFFFGFFFWLLFCASTILYGVQVLRSLSIEQWLSYRKEQIQGKTNCVTVINKSFFLKVVVGCWSRAMRCWSYYLRTFLPKSNIIMKRWQSERYTYNSHIRMYIMFLFVAKLCNNKSGESDFSSML